MAMCGRGCFCCCGCWRQMNSHHEEVCSDAGAAAPAPVAPVPRHAVVPAQPSRQVVESESPLQRPEVGGWSTVVLREAMLLCSEVSSTIACHRRSPLSQCSSSSLLLV